MGRDSQPASPPDVVPFQRPEERFRLGQRPCLDGFRGVATLFVVFAHFGLVRGGVVGLEALFVLSGFLITVMLIEEWNKSGSISIGGFFRRRFRRVFPPLIAMLTIGSFAAVAMDSRTPTEMFWDSVVTISFASNQVLSFLAPASMFGHTWSLSLEIQFYLVWPIALFAMLRSGVRPERIILVIALAILMVSGLRTGLWIARPSADLRTPHMAWLYMRPETHSDTLLVGCLAGALVAWNRLPNTPFFTTRLRKAGWLSLAFLTYSAFYCHHMLPFEYYGLFTVTGLCSAVLIVWLMREPPRFLLRLFDNPISVGAGRISYALYLFHLPIIALACPQSAAAKTAAFASSVGLAVLSFYTIERSVVRKSKPSETPIILRIAGDGMSLRRAA